MFLSTENPTEKLEHDCLLTIEQVYSSRPDLKDKPLKNPDLELFTDGSSFVQEGRRMAGYAVVTTDKLECSGPRILCIPDSKTPGVDLESPLVLSARDSR
ncbi:protein NYNRIN-like [Grus japonensis]|uniref:Protein NYNRIN-like n=1 Tax=Grus japonensis TaxID=30415 RepID=A0ABC9YDI7_GRUJA